MNTDGIAPLAVVIAIDRSGSMAGRNIEMAKAAAASSLDVLPKDAIVAIVAFDVTAAIVVQPTRVRDAEEIRAGIATIEAAQWHTDLPKAYDKAHELHRSMAAEARHVLIVTDGNAASPDEPARNAGWLYDSAPSKEAIQQIHDDGISVSAVGIADADRTDLERFSKDGRVYMVEDVATLPAVFADDLRTLRK